MTKVVHVKLNPTFTWKISNQQKEGSFYQQIGLEFKEETSEMLYLGHSFVWCWNFDISGSSSGTT
jgi:hypothetical protein